MKKIFIISIMVAVLVTNAMGLEFYVSKDGNDNWQGSRGKPFASLHKARSAVRGQIANGLDEDVTVFVGPGTYYLKDTLLFDHRDSGSDEFSITYKALDEDNVPKLVGGVKLNGWKKYKGPIYQADLDSGLTAKQVFENGKRVDLARAPNKGYFKTLKPVEDANQTSFYVRNGDIDLYNLDLSEARIFIWQGPQWQSRWFSQDKGVESVDVDKGIIEMDSSDGYTIDSGNDYYIYNVLGLLDSPGEAVIDLSERKVYVWPTEGEVNMQYYSVSTADNAIRVVGTPDNMVQNVHFKNLDISGANADAVYFDNAKDCSIKYCKIENGYRMGVGLYNKSQNITLYGNEISEHGHRGVYLCGGYPTGKPYMNFGHKVVNNHIHHCGRLIGHGAGVQMLGSGDNQITHNHIHHMPRYGISFKGLVLDYIKNHVPEVTTETRYDYLHTKNNLVAFNDIHHVNQHTQDTGAIEAWGPGRGNVINYNLIHDFGTDEFNHMSGIYLDDAANYFTVTNNIIYGITGISGNNSIFTKGIHNRIENNILIVGNGGTGTAIRSFEMANERADHHEYVNNIIYFEKSEPRLKDYPMEYEWEFTAPEDGTYKLWFYYAAPAWYSGRWDFYHKMNTISIDNKKVQHISDLYVERDMGFRWRKSRTYNLKKGTHLLRYYNEMGSGLKIKKIALCSDEDWKPEGEDFEYPENGHLIMTEPGIDRDLWRTVYEFQNWLDDRVAKADKNIIWKHGDRLLVRKGDENITFADWIRLQDNKFDQNSVITDPMFYDVEERDFRLKPESPALDLGFKPIDVNRIGLKDDFPERF